MIVQVALNISKLVNYTKLVHGRLLFSESLALEALLIGVHCKEALYKCIDTIQYNGL